MSSPIDYDSIKNEIDMRTFLKKLKKIDENICDTYLVQMLAW